MTTRVVTVTGNTPVPVIAGLLRDNRISGVPVVDAGGAVVGLVSEYDLLARGGETASEVMTASVITVSKDTDLEDVRHLLVERRIRRVPVTSGQRLAGIVSRGDVVALLTTEWVCGGRPSRPRPAPAAPVPQVPRQPGRFVMQAPAPAAPASPAGPAGSSGSPPPRGLTAGTEAEEADHGRNQGQDATRARTRAGSGAAGTRRPGGSQAPSAGSGPVTLR